jgi:hypothetical protein
MQSEIIKQVIEDITSREKKGFETYGTTMDRTDLNMEDWLNHAYEEALDFAIYLKKIKSIITQVKTNRKNGTTQNDI